MTGDGRSADERAPLRRPLRPEPLLSALADHGVDFIVVGGYAVAAHGHVRATKDIDICPDPTEENLQQLADALVELQAEAIGLDEFTTKYGRLDVMQHLAGLGRDGGGWKELSPHAVTRNFLGHECLFCGYEDLIKMKRAAGRPQDDIDVKSLKAARGEF
jgi:hypothetical protein